MRFIVTQLAVHKIGGHNDGGFVRCSKSDGVKKAGEGGKKRKKVQRIWMYEREREIEAGKEEVEGTDDDDEWIHRNPGTVRFWSSAIESIVKRSDIGVVV